LDSLLEPLLLLLPDSQPQPLLWQPQLLPLSQPQLLLLLSQPQLLLSQPQELWHPPELPHEP
jgi:hypothetical protein